jgi:lantibiotic modifying enzyme
MGETSAVTDDATSDDRGRSERLGRLLTETAIWSDGRCSWTGDTIIDDAGSVGHRALQGDLYEGTAGVAWFLAHFAVVHDDDQARRTALGAAAHALEWARRTSDEGLYTGRSGVALVAATIGSVLDDAATRSVGAELAAAVAAATHDRHGAHRSWELIDGAAGVAIALATLGHELDRDELLPAAVEIADRLSERSSTQPVGRAWAPDDGGRTLCGLAHGASGAAWALREVAARSGIDRWDEVIAEARRFERAHFDRDQRGWPDLRTDGTDGTDGAEAPGYPVFWCHGAAGIGLARLREFELTGDQVALAETAAALDVGTSVLLRTAPPGSVGLDATLCHGAAAMADLHLLAEAVTGDVEHRVHARRLIERAWPSGDPRQVQCGVPAGRRAPGLMLGLAGLGAVSLRLSGGSDVPSPISIAAWATGT